MSKFRFEEFNQRRHMRGAEAARVTWVNDQGEEDSLWMSPADIRSNILEHGPHYGLLVAASHYHMKADQLVALHRSKGKNKAFLSPIEPAHGLLGHWAHPDYPAAGENWITEESFGEWLKLIGYESAMRELDGDEPAFWHPVHPVGSGWFIGSIHDTEDGTMCIWMRKLEVA